MTKKNDWRQRFAEVEEGLELDGVQYNFITHFIDQERKQAQIEILWDLGTTAAIALKNEVIPNGTFYAKCIEEKLKELKS